MRSSRTAVILLASLLAASSWVGAAEGAGADASSGEGACSATAAPARAADPGLPCPTERVPLPQAGAASTDRTQYIRNAIAGPGLPREVKGRRLTGLGTGFFISNTRLLTNHHVAGQCAVVTRRIGEERNTAIASVIATDQGHDLALLASDERSGGAAPFARELSGNDAPYSVVGYPEHGLATVRPSLVEVSIDPGALDPTTPFLTFRGTVRRGNSGGPLLDRSGAVVGIVARKLNAPAVYKRTGQMPEDVGFAVPLRIVAEFVKANDTKVAVSADASSLTAEELLDKGRAFIAQIGCWN
jgi:S1-C subfamily serine protease